MRAYAALLGLVFGAPVLAQDAASLLSTARSQLVSSHLDECQHTLDQILSAHPKNVAALKLRSDVHYLQGEDAKAESSLLEAIAIEPRNPELHYALGRIYYQQTRPEPAIERFQKVIELDPDPYKAYDNLGLCYQALNRQAEAITAFLKALDLVHEKHRDYERPYANLANLLIARGDYAKAFELTAEAAARNPRSARNLFLTGKALVKLKKLDLAVRWLKRATEVDPDYPEAHYLLAHVYRVLGRDEEGNRELRQFEEARARTPATRR